MNLKGFKDQFSNGYTLLLIDNSGKVLAKLKDPYFEDLKSIKDNLGLKYLGKTSTFWDKIFRNFKI